MFALTSAGGLNFEGTEVHNPSLVIVRDQYDVDIARHATVLVMQPNLRQGGPPRILREEKIGSVVGDEPILPKTNRARNDHVIAMEDAANAKRIVRLILGAIGNLVVEGAKTLVAIAGGKIGLIVERKAEYLGQRMRR